MFPYRFRVCTGWERGSPRSDCSSRRSSSSSVDICRVASVEAPRCHWRRPDSFAGIPRRKCRPTWRRSKVSARSEVGTSSLPPEVRRTVYRETLPRDLIGDCSVPVTRRGGSSKFNINGGQPAETFLSLLSIRSHSRASYFYNSSISTIPKDYVSIFTLTITPDGRLGGAGRNINLGVDEHKLARLFFPPFVPRCASSSFKIRGTRRPRDMSLRIHCARGSSRRKRKQPVAG